MKSKSTALFLAAVLAAGLAVPAGAAPSISQIIPENPTVITGNLAQGQTLIVQNAAPASYTDQKAAEAVEMANDDSTKTTVTDILTKLGIDSGKSFTTGDGKTVNPTLYEMLTPFVDLAVEENGSVTYTSSGEIHASVVIEAAKEMDRHDILLMQIDPSDGTVYFITVEELEAETGKITATFPTLGPVALLEKVPVIVKAVGPDLYTDTKTADLVRSFSSQTSGILFSDVLQKHDKENGASAAGEAVIADGVTVNAEDYSSVMGFSDLAIRQGESYTYNMKGNLLAEVHRSIDGIDWARIAQSADEEFDVSAAEADPSLLTDLGEFVLRDSFLMQLNAETGEVSYIYEPEVKFEYFDQSEEETEAAEDSQTDLMHWTAEDEDGSAEKPDLVIKGEFTGMGPFTLFMPTAE